MTLLMSWVILTLTMFLVVAAAAAPGAVRIARGGNR